MRRVRTARNHVSVARPPQVELGSRRPRPAFHVVFGRMLGLCVVLVGCSPEVRLALGGEDAAAAARSVLRRYDISATTDRGMGREVRVRDEDQSRAEALLQASGFARVAAPEAPPLVAGPSELAAQEERRRARALQIVLRSLPDVLNAEVVPTGSGAAVFLWRPADAGPPEAANRAARAVYGDAVPLLSTPVAAPARRAERPPRPSLELPLAVLALALAAALFVVARRRQAEART